MKIEHCDRCQEPDVVLVLSNGDRVCGKCAKSAMRFTRAEDNHFKSKIFPVTKIDVDCHLDMIVAQIMAFFITNGMSVRQCACQLGITHATIYSKLRKTGMMKPPGETDCILNPTIGDFRTAGGLGKEFVIVQERNPTKKPQKCVTQKPKHARIPGVEQVTPERPKNV